MSKWPWPVRLNRITRFSPVLRVQRLVDRRADGVAVSGAGMIPSVRANRTAASKHRSGERPRLDVPAWYQQRDDRGHAVIAQPAGVDRRRHEVVAERVHLDERRQARGVAEVVAVRPPWSGSGTKAARRR